MYVSAFGLNSTRKNYFVNEGGVTNRYTVGSYSLVVEMTKGVVTALTWIDGCSECPSSCANTGQSLTCPDSVCLTNDCTIPEGDCHNANHPVTTCDLKIFLAWVGSDAHSRPCTSSGSLPYNFLQFGLTPAFRAAAGVTDQYLFNISKIGSSLPTV